MAKNSMSASLPLLTRTYCEMFRRGMFGFICEHDGLKHEKQEHALRLLTDYEHTEILYGGAAGGAKTWTGAAWLLFSCLCYAETKWFIGRATLTEITKSTWVTFQRVAKCYGLFLGEHYKFNAKDNYISFANGSRIDFLDLRYMPGDPMYERYGSQEYTGGWIEEGGEVNFGAYDTLRTRVGRWLNRESGLRRKLFVTCNPKKNWMYQIFYKPWKAGTLLSHMAYIACLVQENPFIDPDYIEGLRSTADKVKYERLFKGNWEYDDNPNALCSHDAILEIFGSKISIRTGTNYLTGDIARFGADHARIAVWDGWTIIDYRDFPVSKTTDIQTYIDRCQRKYRIPNRRCIVDEDGVGGGVVDNCDIQGFVNNSSPLNGENYQNLQVQCGYKLAEHINNGDVGVIDGIFSEQQIEEIVNELEQLQTWNVDNDGKLMLKPKAEIKADLGRSPDYRDMFLMRSWFDYNEWDIPDDIERKLGIY